MLHSMLLGIPPHGLIYIQAKKTKKGTQNLGSCQALIRFTLPNPHYFCLLSPHFSFAPKSVALFGPFLFLSFCYQFFSPLR
jgi:hypothetical protein